MSQDARQGSLGSPVSLGNPRDVQRSWRRLGQWKSRRIRCEPRQACIHSPPNSDLSCYTGPYRRSQDSTRLESPPILLAGIANCAEKCPIGALLHPPKPLWMWLRSASTPEGTISTSRRGHKACGARHQRSRNPGMGILGEVALYDWDRQLATEGRIMTRA